MVKPSAYQLQAVGRAKRATKQLSAADTRVRSAARMLADALAEADKARAAVAAVNTSYGTGYRITTNYVEALTGQGAAEALQKAGEAAPTAEYPPIISTFENSKDGAELPGLAALGEYVAPVAEKAVKPKKTAAEKLNEAVTAVGES